MAESLNWLVFGAGAIGTYIGGSLALMAQNGRTPQRVTFIERPEIAATIRQNGLQLRFGDQDHHLEGPIVTESLPEALSQGPYDAAVFAVKSYHTRGALAGIAPLAADMPPVLCLQNGVENENLLAETLGWDKVIPGAVTSAIGRRGVGDIALEKQRGLGIASGHERAAALAAVLDEAGLNARLYQRASDMKWSKLLTNLLANATAAILDMSPRRVLAHPASYQLERAVQRETLQVMDALGHKVVDLPGTPVRLLAYGMRWLPESISQPLMVRFAGNGRGDKMPSLHIDLHSGSKHSEVDALNGAVARFGAKVGVPTPANQLLNDVLLQLVRGEMPVDAFAQQPEKLLQIYRQSS